MNTIRYRVVSNPHWATHQSDYRSLEHYFKAFREGKELLKCHATFFRFVEDFSLSESDKAVLAFTEKEVVGVFRFNVSTDRNFSTVYAYGTWVRASHRRQGIASEMWRRALRKRHSVEVTTATKAGANFVGQFQTRHNYEIIHDDCW